MPGEHKPTVGPCNPAYTSIIKFMTDRELPPSVGISLPPYTSIAVHQYFCAIYSGGRR